MSKAHSVLADSRVPERLSVPEVPMKTPLGLLPARHRHQTPIPEACRARGRFSAYQDPLWVFSLHDPLHHPDMESKPLCLQLRQERWSTQGHIASCWQCQTLIHGCLSSSLSPEPHPATSDPQRRGQDRHWDVLLEAERRLPHLGLDSSIPGREGRPGGLLGSRRPCPGGRHGGDVTAIGGAHSGGLETVLDRGSVEAWGGAGRPRQSRRWWEACPRQVGHQVQGARLGWGGSTR